MSETLAGSCLCGAVKYEITGRVKSVVNCHCGLCKKITGAAFETIAIISERSLEIICGEDHLISYTLTENADKKFCGICGTPIFNTNKKVPGNSMVHIGSLDEPSRISPAINVYCSGMLPWVTEIEGLSSYENGAL